MATQSLLSSNWSDPDFLTTSCSNLVHFSPEIKKSGNTARWSRAFLRPVVHGNMARNWVHTVLWMGAGLWGAIWSGTRPVVPLRDCAANSYLENRHLKISLFEVFKTLSWCWSHILLIYQTPEIALTVSQAPCCIYKQLQHSRCLWRDQKKQHWFPNVKLFW